MLLAHLKVESGCGIFTAPHFVRPSYIADSRNVGEEIHLMLELGESEGEDMAGRWDEDARRMLWPGVVLE